MNRAHWVGLLILIAVALFQARVTRRVWQSQSFDRPQKVAQSKLIWLLPVVGAALVSSVLEAEDDRTKGPPPGLGR